MIVLSVILGFFIFGGNKSEKEVFIDNAISEGFDRDTAEEMYELATVFYGDDLLSDEDAKAKKETENEKEIVETIEEKITEVPDDVREKGMHALEKLVETNAVSQQQAADHLTLNFGISPIYAEILVSEIAVDWQMQAANHANKILEEKVLSEKALIHQLVLNGHAEDMAQSVVEKIDVDWLGNATLSAEKHIRDIGATVDDLNYLLNDEGYTTEQIAQAVKNVGL